MKKILLSAGHNNLDPGAVSVNGKYKEAILATKLRDRVFKRLVEIYLKDDLAIYRDGEDGDNQPLTRAIELAKRMDLAIEFHFNAGGGLKGSGIEALAHRKHKLIAQLLCSAVHHVLPSLPLRGDKGYKAADSGQHHRLGFCEAGGIILEVCFISNPEEINLYVDNKLKVADALAEEIKEITLKFL